jgi:UDP-N-acetylmuramate--alanine ligase
VGDAHVFDLSVPRRVHVVWIGGKAMSAIAEILVEMGHRVTGSDPNEVAVMGRLRDLGIVIAVGGVTELPGDVELVVRSSGVADDHPEVVDALRRGVPVLGRPQVQGAIAQTRRTIAVSGTHGKTSTTAMLVHVLESVGADPSYIVGGDLARDAGGVRWGSGEWFVVEADESDGTFLELGAERVLVTNVAADHLDRYGTIDAIAEAFEAFVAAASDAWVGADDTIAASIGRRHGARSFGLSVEADVQIRDVVVERGVTRFVVAPADHHPIAVVLPEPGRHNALNATAALAAAVDTGVGWPDAARALADYPGVGRRFEVRGAVGGITVVDDYAHNPGKVQAVVEAAAHGGWGRVVVVFQPHRYSRTADLWEEFASSFDGADAVVVTELDPAGESPRPGVSGRLIVDALMADRPRLPVEWVPDRTTLVDHLADRLEPGDLCLTLGAGDITTLADALLPRLEERFA